MLSRSHRNLTGQRAILTGGSSGVGRALVRTLAERGTRLLVTGRREERLAAVAAEFPTQISFLAGDITSAQFRQHLVEQANEDLGGLDLVVAAAGSGAVGPFAESSSETLRNIFEVDFFAPVELLRLTLPVLKQGRQPAAVLVGSILGVHPLPLHAEYSSAKAALQCFAQAVRPELAAAGISTVVAILGPTESEFWENLLTGERPSWSQGRPLSAEATAAAIVRAIEHDQDLVQPGWRTKAFAGLARYMPSVIDLVVRRKRQAARRA